MKFLLSLSPLALVSLALVLSACANPANRRELYNTSQADSGPWHDYERRREAESVTGVSGGSAPTVVPGTRGRATTAPSSPLPAGTTAAPAAVQGADSVGAPPVPVNPPTPAAVATPAPDAAAPAAVPGLPDATATPAPTPASP